MKNNHVLRLLYFPTWKTRLPLPEVEEGSEPLVNAIYAWQHTFIDNFRSDVTVEKPGKLQKLRKTRTAADCSDRIFYRSSLYGFTSCYISDAGGILESY
ncbi:MAG: hypothetical protein ACLS7Q_08380 [Varibaculum cambriense]